MMKKLEIGTRTLKQMGEDVLEAWKAAEAGQNVRPRQALYFANRTQLLAAFARKPGAWTGLPKAKADWNSPKINAGIADELADGKLP